MEILRSSLKTHQNRWGDTNVIDQDSLLHRKTPCGKVLLHENEPICEKCKKHVCYCDCEEK